MAIERLTVLKLVGLAVGCLAKFTTGSLFVFNVYQNAIKDTFNYTQKDVEVFSSMLNIGLGVGFLPGMFYDRFGPQWASVLGLVVSVSGYMLVWSTPRSIKFYSHNSWLMAIYFFIIGLGSVFTYMVALNTNIINFDQKHTGKIVGILNAFFAGSPSIFATIYYNLFTHGDSTNTKNQDFQGFMLLFVILFVIADIMCIMFLRLYKNDSVGFETFENESTGNNDNSDKVSATAEGENSETLFKTAAKSASYGINSQESNNETADLISDQSQTLIGVLKNVDYQILVWTFAFASVIGLVYVNNITVISRSVKLDKYDNGLTIIIPITNAILSALVGLFSDYFIDRIPRLWIIIFANICFTVSQILVFLFADKLGILIVSTILAGVGIAIIWSIGPTVMKEMFNVTNIGRNWGIAIFIAALLGFAFQEVFGALYDAEAPKGDSVHCYGMKCIKGGLGVTMASGALSVALGIFMQIRGRCCQRRDQ